MVEKAHNMACASSTYGTRGSKEFGDGECKSPSGWDAHRRPVGSGSLGGSVSSVHSLASPVGRRTSAPSPLSSPGNIFGNIGKLDFSAALRSANGTCACCRSSNRMDMVDTNTTKIPYITVARPFNRYNADFSQELWEAFGEDVVEKIFDEEGIQPQDVRCLANAGLNHEFIAISAQHLVKLIVPAGANVAGEAHEMEFLRKHYPAIAEDPTVCFPKKCFRLVTGGTPPVYDVVALEYHEGAMSVREMVQVFERAPAEEKARLYAGMYNLVGEQVPQLLWRYQRRHLRKHGDGKADNILVTGTGMLILCDMGSTFNDSLKPCDRDEYLRSLPTLDGQLAEMKRRFDEVFRSLQDVPEPSAHETQNIQRRNVLLLQDIQKLQKKGPASGAGATHNAGLLNNNGLFGARQGNQFAGGRLNTNLNQGALMGGNRLGGMAGATLLQPVTLGSPPVDPSDAGRFAF